MRIAKLPAAGAVNQSHVPRHELRKSALRAIAHKLPQQFPVILRHCMNVLPRVAKGTQKKKFTFFDQKVWIASLKVDSIAVFPRIRIA